MEIVCVLIVIMFAEWKITKRLDEIIDLLKDNNFWEGKS